MGDPARSAGGGLLAAARIIAGRADAPPHVLAAAEHFLSQALPHFLIGTAVAEAEVRRKMGQPTFSTISESINEDESQKRVKLVD